MPGSEEVSTATTNKEQSGIDVKHIPTEVALEASLRELVESTEDLLNNWPAEGFPDIKAIFGFHSLDELIQDPEKRKEVCKQANDIIALITGYTTDLNAIKQTEYEMLEGIGYTLASYKYRADCFDLFEKILHNPSDKPYSTRIKDNLTFENIFKVFSDAKNTWDKKFRRAIGI